LIYYEPQQAPNYGLLSNALIKLNQIPSALVYSRLAVQLAPDQWQAHQVHAKALEANKELDKALSAYRKALELAPASRRETFEKEIIRLESSVLYSSS
ncbi:MAG: hypothetical protein MI673_02450, partial [Thiotrichales bacterium]|nr:hypothetical protein [Thiotrichales bacterium]